MTWVIVSTARRENTGTSVMLEADEHLRLYRGLE
jgi:hypothetical protein